MPTSRFETGRFHSKTFFKSRLMIEHQTKYQDCLLRDFHLFSRLTCRFLIKFHKTAPSSSVPRLTVSAMLQLINKLIVQFLDGS